MTPSRLSQPLKGSGGRLWVWVAPPHVQQVIYFSISDHMLGEPGYSYQTMPSRHRCPAHYTSNTPRDRRCSEDENLDLEASVCKVGSA